MFLDYPSKPKLIRDNWRRPPYLFVYQYLSYEISHLDTNKDHKTELSVSLRWLYVSLKWSRTFDNSKRKFGLNKNWKANFRWSHLHSLHLHRWHRHVYLWHFVPSLSTPPFLFFSTAISLLRYCRVIGNWMFIFFLFPVCCDYFIAWSSLVFHLMEYSGEHDVSFHHKHVLKYRNLPVFWVKL